MARTAIALLRGGTSSEYDASLKTGSALITALPEEHYDIRDVLIDRRGVWHARGIPMEPTRALLQADVLLNALHGGMGEDGTVQRIAERLHLPYTGSRPLSSALSLNKVRTHEILRDAGIVMPRAVAFRVGSGLDTGEMTRLVFSQFGPPYIVKPLSEGSSFGVLYAPSVLELPDLLADTLESHGDALVEEYVIGDEAVVGIVQDFRNQSLYALPPAHVARPSGNRILPYSLRIAGDVHHVVPSPYPYATKQTLEDIARKAHTALGLSHYSTVDFILSRRGPVLLEVDAQPHMHERSAFARMLEAVGSSLREFWQHVIDLARRGV